MAFVTFLRVLLGLTLIFCSVAVIMLGVALCFTIILLPIGLAVISAGASFFAIGVAIAGGTREYS